MRINLDAQTTFTWDPRANRYRDKAGGRFVSEKAIIALTEARAAKASDDLAALGSRLISGSINLTTFQIEFAEQLKTLHAQQAMLGKGGLKAMGDPDWLRVARRLKDEYKYLRGFAKDLRAGSLSERQIQARIQLYAKHAIVSYRESQEAVQKEKGSRYVRRTLGKCSPHCRECLTYAARGWQPIGKLPVPGLACSCGANCCCVIKYVGSLAEDVLA